jgi:hypothetical protein
MPLSSSCLQREPHLNVPERRAFRNAPTTFGNATMKSDIMIPWAIRAINPAVRVIKVGKISRRVPGKGPANPQDDKKTM